jgi:hypothetical protein
VVPRRDGYVGLWGDNQTGLSTCGPIFVQTDASLSFIQSQFDVASYLPWNAPTISWSTFGDGIPAGRAAFVSIDGSNRGLTDVSNMYVWDASLGRFAIATVPLTWANMTVAAPAGFEIHNVADTPVPEFGIKEKQTTSCAIRADIGSPTRIIRSLTSYQLL